MSPINSDHEMIQQAEADADAKGGDIDNIRPNERFVNKKRIPPRMSNDVVGPEGLPPPTQRGSHFESKTPSLAALQIMATSDQALFENEMAKIGLRVIGTKDIDPLRKSVQEESIQSIASVITEGDEKLILNDYQNAVRTMAEGLGYIIEIK